MDKSDAYYSTHNAVHAIFKLQSSDPVGILFLCEREGNAVLLGYAMVGNNDVEPGDLMEQLAIGAAVKAGAQQAGS